MLLVLDIGNTHTCVGIFDGACLVTDWRLTSERRTEDELGIYLTGLLRISGIDQKFISGSIISSVVPPLEMAWREGISKYLGLEAMVVKYEMNLGIDVQYEVPSEVGADRLVNAVAAVHHYGSPVIVVDFGTAVTLDYVTSDRAYLGGAIAPGLQASVEALFGKTAKLPLVALDTPKRVIGRSTSESMRSGIVVGYAGLIDGLVDRMAQEQKENPKVIATGGHAEIVARWSSRINTVDPNLTLEGLRLIYERNAK
ncbi:pantothenate kinase, type III [Acetomicrobium mobile DSM 13181]|uniref:Type III pantothenate kinase n=1 Tax=Acetomicrobium mobile (strain ATCC BAA-54 / DSM 13181 / JCM 12221 / NGA) TaxID=891968 RepID=I4BXV0_ACEMN|nr:type III pantothenate kinase [Acetomicrobium mobile]AFM22107.1 pantothenate kinase, type III [Acetomicrobium mobile DSM 13181]